jgi:hypothetical protein
LTGSQVSINDGSSSAPSRGKSRSYAEVLAGAKGSFETQACHRRNSTGSDASSVPAQRRGQHSLNVSKFPAPSDGACREEPPRSFKWDNFWDSEYGLPMSTKSFRTIDSAFWVAIKEDWSGFKEVGMRGKNLALLQGGRIKRFQPVSEPRKSRSKADESGSSLYRGKASPRSTFQKKSFQ